MRNKRVLCQFGNQLICSCLTFVKRNRLNNLNNFSVFRKDCCSCKLQFKRWEDRMAVTDRRVEMTPYRGLPNFSTNPSLSSCGLHRCSREKMAWMSCLTVRLALRPLVLVLYRSVSSAPYFNCLPLENSTLACCYLFSHRNTELLLPYCLQWAPERVQILTKWPSGCLWGYS